MSAQGATLATTPDDGAMVDAYVDALLAMPLAPPAVPAPSAAAPAVAADAQAEPAPEARPALDVESEFEPGSASGTEVEAAIEVEASAEAEAAARPEPEADAWPGDEAAFDRMPALPPGAPPSAAPASPAAQFVPQAMPAAPAPLPAPLAEPEEDRLIHAAPTGQRWLRVAVGDDRYAVELLRVQEVVRLAPVIAVRGAVPSLLGVMNLRGRVVPVHDLGRWLRRMPVEPDERARIVVLEYQDELVGLMVTAVTDVVTLDTPQIEPPTPGLRDRIGMGIARTPGAPPTVLLDARVVFD